MPLLIYLATATSTASPSSSRHNASPSQSFSLSLSPSFRISLTLHVSSRALEERLPTQRRYHAAAEHIFLSILFQPSLYAYISLYSILITGPPNPRLPYYAKRRTSRLGQLAHMCIRPPFRLVEEGIISSIEWNQQFSRLFFYLLIGVLFSFDRRPSQWNRCPRCLADVSRFHSSRASAPSLSFYLSLSLSSLLGRPFHSR